MMNLRLASPARLLDIGSVEGLSGVEQRGSVVRIGAMTRHCAVEASTVIAERAPLLALAIQHVAHLAVRNRGTLGGSLALADPAAEMPACMLALGATLVAGSRSGERRIGAEEFFQGLYTTALRPDEVLLAAEVPAATADDRYAFQEFSRRHGDFAVAGIAMWARCTGAVTAMRVAAFGIADRPVLLPALGRSIADNPSLDSEACKVAIGTDVVPNGDLHYSGEMRLHVAAELAMRCIRGLFPADERRAVHG
jgi:carbon-monoxide dehydrogenase medium subunit